MAGHGLVHCVVEQFGHEVVQRALVRAADKHARPTAYGLQALQDLDIVRAVVGRRRRGAAVGGALEQVVHASHYPAVWPGDKPLCQCDPDRVAFECHPSAIA
jgi:hypothetical protein